MSDHRTVEECNDRVRKINDDVKTIGRDLKRVSKKLNRAIKRIKKLEDAGNPPQPPGVLEGIFFGAHAPGSWFSANEMVDLTISSNANAIAYIPLAYMWSAGNLSPFMQIAGKNDLHAFSNEWLAFLSAADKKAASNNIAWYCYALDQIGLKDYDGRASRHPFNALTNIHDDLVAGHVYNNCDPAKTQFHNLVERAIKYPDRDPRLQAMHNRIKSYVQNLTTYFPNWIYCTGNELDSRSVENIAMTWSDRIKSINGDYLWNGNETAEQLLADDTKRVMFANVKYLEFHHCGPLNNSDQRFNTKHHYAVFERIRQDYPHLKMIGSSDGVGSGYDRGANGRMTFEQEHDCVQWIREQPGYGGWLIKTTTKADTEKMIEVF